MPTTRKSPRAKITSKAKAKARPTTVAKKSAAKKAVAKKTVAKKTVVAKKVVAKKVVAKKVVAKKATPAKAVAKVTAMPVPAAASSSRAWPGLPPRYFQR